MSSTNLLLKRRVDEVMTRALEVVEPDLCVREVAARMRDRNIGAVPVCEEGRLLGMLTDRDLALRVLAEGRDPETTLVQEVMSTDIATCAPDDRLDDVLLMLAGRQIRRVPVVSADGRLVGLVTLAKIAESDCEASGEVLKEVLQPAPRHDP